MFFFKIYSNSFLATVISILASLSLVGGAIGIISFFTAGMKDSGNIILGIVLVAVWFVLRKLADSIAAKKGK